MTTGLIITGGIIALCGYLVGYRNKVHWLAGYNPETVKNPEAVGKYFGNHLLAMGLVGLVPGLALLAAEVPVFWAPIVLLGYAGLVIFWTIIISFSGKPEK